MVSVKLTGGLANILLQCCACLGYAAKHKIPYAIPTVTTNKRWKHYKFPGICYEDADTRNYFHYREPAIQYEKRPYDITFQDIPYHENILLEGHFLSHKYWWDYKDEILPLFGFNWQPLEDIIAIHVRRSDYLMMQQYLPVLPFDYYYQAMMLAMHKTGMRRFIIFSDDINFCQGFINKETFPLAQEIIYSNGNEIQDLEVMSSCPVIITANSTFSVFTSYLNKHENKVIICPDPWYGPAYGEVNTNDMYPEGCHIIKYK